MHQQIRGGRLVRRNNRKFVSIQKRLHRLQERYDSGSLIATDFITGVSYNLAEPHWPATIVIIFNVCTSRHYLLFSKYCLAEGYWNWWSVCGFNVPISGQWSASILSLLNCRISGHFCRFSNNLSDGHWTASTISLLNCRSFVILYFLTSWHYCANYF